MTAEVQPQQTGHTDTVHDVQLDYYGKRLATCSSDRTINIFDVHGDSLQQVSQLHGHEGPVWQVAWAHPKFGNVLASCAFDHKVIVWRQQADGSWVQAHHSTIHTASVNGVAFAPHEVGLELAAVSSDGCVSIHTYSPSDAQWHVSKEEAHSTGCTAVSWSPAAPPRSLVSGKPVTQPLRRFATAGCDKAVRIWQHNDNSRRWEQVGNPLQGHDDWVRDVAWAPAIGMPMHIIASAGQDGKVLIWSERPDGWSSQVLHDFGLGQPVWKLSWSVTGNVLAVSDSSSTVTLWKEALDGKWQKIAAPSM